MTRHTTATAILICPIPRGAPVAEVAAWMARSRGSDVPVTWAVCPEAVSIASEAAADTIPDLALDLSGIWPASRQAIRQTLRSARETWPHLETALLRGPAGLDHRDTLVQEGITTIAVDQFDSPARGSRRPAPRGWPCRSILWGLWEVAVSAGPRTGLIGQLKTWCHRGGGAGGLSILDAGGSSSVATIRNRFDRHLAWIRRKSPSGLQAITLSDLPAVLCGGGDAASRGSVLRAA